MWGARPARRRLKGSAFHGVTGSGTRAEAHGQGDDDDATWRSARVGGRSRKEGVRARRLGRQRIGTSLAGVLLAEARREAGHASADAGRVVPWAVVNICTRSAPKAAREAM